MPQHARLEQTIYAARSEHQRRREEFSRLQDDHRRQLEGIQLRLKDRAREDDELERQRGRLEQKITMRSSAPPKRTARETIPKP